MKGAYSQISIALTLGSALMHFACSEDQLPSHTMPPDPERVAVAEHGGYVSSLELLLYPREGVDDDIVLSAVRRCDAELVGRIPQINLWQIMFANPGDNLETLQEHRGCLNGEEAIRSVFYNGVSHLSLFPDDGYQSGSVTDDCRCPDAWDTLIDDTWGLQVIGAPFAWDVTTGDPEVVVAIVDGDFDTSHRDLAADEAEELASRVCHHESILHQSGSPFPFEDPDLLIRHGTHVAGIIGARGDNSLAIAGMDWRSCLYLYSVMFASSDLEAMVNAAHDGAHVVNRSLGWGWEEDGKYPHDPADAAFPGVTYGQWLDGQQELWSPVLEELAEARGGRGTLVVNAAGNGSNPDNDDPEEQIIDARWSGGPNTLNEDDLYGDQILVVASVGRPYPDTSDDSVFTDWEDRWWELAWFSSAGETTDVAAPGASITSLAPGSPYSNGVRSLSGSSMAAPFVTGLASLLFSLDPDLTAAQVHRLIIAGAERRGMPVPGQGFSVISAPESLALLLNGATTVEWSGAFAGEGSAVASRVDVGEDGSVAICGMCFGGSIDLDPGPESADFICHGEGQNDVFVVTLDDAGRFRWGKVFGDAEMETCLTIAWSPEGDVYVGGDFGGTVAFDPEGGGFALTAAGENDAFLSRLSSDGHHIWTQAFGGLANDLVSFVEPTEDGRLIVAGGFGGTVQFDDSSENSTRRAVGMSDAFVGAFDLEGNLDWVTTFGGPGWEELLDATIQDGDVLVAGYFEHVVDFDGGDGEDLRESNGGWDAFVVRISGSGEHVWSRTFGGPGDDATMGIDSRDDGAVFVTGVFEELVDFDPGLGMEEAMSNGDWDAFVLRMNDRGDTFWVRSVGGRGFDTPMALATSGYDWIYVAGTFSTEALFEVDFDPGPRFDRRDAMGGQDAFVLALDARGEYGWTRVVGGLGENFDVAHDVAVSTSGTPIVVGSVQGRFDLEPGWSDEQVGRDSGISAFFMALDQR